MKRTKTGRKKTLAQRKKAAWAKLKALAAEYNCCVCPWISEGRYPGAEIRIERNYDQFAKFSRHSRAISLALIDEAIRWFDAPAVRLPAPAAQPRSSSETFWQANGPLVVADARYTGAVPIAVTREPQFWQQLV